MTTDREKTFVKLAIAADFIRTTETVFASYPGETDTKAKQRLMACPPEVIKAARLLRKLEALMPLERDPENGVWETLLIESTPDHVWISVAGSAGQGERVTTFGVDPAYAAYVESWSASRENSPVEDSEWDAARTAERRIVDYLGERVLIDRGANLMIDRIEDAGCTTTVSCEGHPSGAYVGFHGDGSAEVAAEFGRIGWRTENSHDQVIARMPRVANVAERDSMWRDFARDFHPASDKPKP